MLNCSMSHVTYFTKCYPKARNEGINKYMYISLCTKQHIAIYNMSTVSYL